MSTPDPSPMPGQPGDPPRRPAGRGLAGFGQAVSGGVRLPLEAGFHNILQFNAIATIAGASAFCALLWGEMPESWLAGWWGVMAVSSVLMLIDRHVYLRRDRLRWWPVLDILTACLCGLAWGSSVFGMPMLDEEARLLTIAAIAGVMGFSAPALSMVPLAGTLFLFGVAAPFATYFALRGTVIDYGLSALLIGFVGMMLSTNLSLNRILSRNRQLGSENATLYARIRDAQAELLSVADSSEAFVFFDTQGRVQLWNRRLPALLGLADDSLQRGVALAPLLERAGLPADLTGQLESAAPGTPRPVLRLAGGEWVRAGLRRTEQNDRALVLIDITEQQATSAELSRKNARLEELFNEVSEARDVALRASRAKSTFLANMSHELRTPLNAIIGFSDIIRQKMFGPASPKYDNYIEDIYGSGQHLLGIINDILDLARIEANQIVLNEEVVDPADEIATCIRLATQQFGLSATTLVARPVDDLPDLRADARLIRQILLNLIGNAVKFSPPDAPVEIGARRTETGEIEIWVHDRGIGIAAADQTRIFEPFEQADSQHSRKFGGLGLGLSLVRAFVAAHQGHVTIDSRPGHGTRICAVFPATRSIAVDRSAPTAA